MSQPTDLRFIRWIACQRKWIRKVFTLYFARGYFLLRKSLRGAPQGRRPPIRLARKKLSFFELGAMRLIMSQCGKRAQSLNLAHKDSWLAVEALEVCFMLGTACVRSAL
uniref:Uncharacterized protein n=1 Tax=OCS116 cluster bacterium TaxID=2030921 RepID=A0A2A4YWW8_9PROT